jgi:4-amino-4-deoxy-L-arabinose transferase-like glycosyltransferase
LHLPSPPLREFFDVSHVVNDGRYYGKYAPGWPAVLALAVLLGQPWLANLLIGVAILALTFVLARRHYGARTANIAMVLGFACPSMVFNDASLFSHPLCLLALTGATLAWFECLDRPCARLPFIVLGAAAGLAFVTRPFTTVVAVGCFAVSAAVHRAPRTPSFWRNILILSVGGALIFVIPFLCYNRAQTGAWLLQPFEL